MSIEQKIKVLGRASIFIGVVTAFLCLFPKFLLIALPLGFIGMICSSIYVYIDTKNDINTRKFTPGIIGLLLSSSPVLLILSFIIINYFNR
jgi:hypothetical protein